MAASTSPTYRIAISTTVPSAHMPSFNVRIADLGIKTRANRFGSMGAAVQGAIALQAAYEAHIAECQERKDPTLPAIHVPTVHFHAIACAPGARVRRTGGGLSIARTDVTARIATGCVVGTAR